MKKTSIILCCCFLGFSFVLPGQQIDSLLKIALVEAERLSDSARDEDAVLRLNMARQAEAFESAKCETRLDFYYDMGAYLYYLNRPVEALVYWKDSTLANGVECWGENSDKVAKYHRVTGLVYGELADNEQQVFHFEQSLAIQEKQSTLNFGDLGDLMVDIAEVYIRLSDYQEAYAYLEQAQNYYRQAPELMQGTEARLYEIWGLAAYKASKFEEALANSEIAASLYGQNTPAAVWHNIGAAHLGLQQYEEALSIANVALAMHEESNYIAGIAFNKELIATIYKKKQDFQLAERFYRESLVLRQEASNVNLDAYVANSYENLADLAQLRNASTEAITLYQQSIAQLIDQAEGLGLFENPVIQGRLIRSRSDLVRVLDLKAQTYLSVYQREGGAHILGAALDAYDKIDTLLNQVRQGFQAGGSKYMLQEAIVPIYERAILAHLALHQESQAAEDLANAYRFAAKNKALILLEGLQDEKARTFADIPQKLIKQENKLKQDYYTLEASLIEAQFSPAEKAKQQDSLFQLKRRYDKLVAQLESDYPAYYDLKYSFVEPLSANELQAELDAKTLFVEYFVGDEYLFIFAISREGLQFFQQAKAADFEETIQTFRQILQLTDPTGQEARFSAAAYRLYQYLLETPLANWGGTSPLKRLKIIPDDRLLQLPFDVLLTASTTEGLHARTAPYLLKKYAISYGYSNQLAFGRKRDRKRIEKAHSPFAGFGLEYDDFTFQGLAGSNLEQVGGKKRNMGRLKYSDDEVLEAAAILGGRTWVNQKATKAAFLENANRYGILHLAMHALVDNEQPLNSALIFSRTADSSDFMLRAADLYSQRIEADLAVLSACNTGFGSLEKGEGIRSLARAFTYAGCNRLMATLWEAADHSTKDILLAFYKTAKASPSQPIDVLLQEAKLAYLETAPPTFTSPSYWAHLMILGDALPLGTQPQTAHSLLPMILLGLFLFVAGGLVARRYLSAKAAERLGEKEV